MKTYNTYQEAKIANPECDAVFQNNITKEFSARFGPSGANKMYGLGINWHFCRPPEHCMTVEGFLKAGHKLVSGDIIIHRDEGFFIMPDSFGSHWNDIVPDEDSKSYILRAAALEKPKRTKFEYVKVTDSIFDLKGEFDGGWLSSKAGGHYVNIDNLDSLLLAYRNDNVYRKVETEIDERQEFIDECQKYGSWEEMFDSGKFKLVN